VACDPGREPVAAARFFAVGGVYCGVATEIDMLRLALFFLVVSLVAALFGFTGISAAAAGIAKILFFIFIVIFVVLLIAALMAGSVLF
jgi:uncharacterized membrane protein YtjA (UPF0391 family)